MNIKEMDYWQLRKLVSKIIPRQAVLSGKDFVRQKEKGRKSNYHQFNIVTKEMDKMERLLNQDELATVAEVSLRAQSCPMPFNMDIWDGLKCPYACKYCFADYFRHSLYTSFFDNGTKVGLRHAKEENWKRELEKVLSHKGEKVEGENQALNAARLNIPLRLGIQFEDFTKSEARHHVSLGVLKYLAEINYPVMINTKSDLLGTDEYAQALVDNKAGAAVHITMISSNEDFIKLIEPGAPSFANRIKAAKALTEKGIRVVARIEPWMIYLNDKKEDVDYYISELKKAGVEHLTLDTYSYSAYSQGLKSNFSEIGIDFERMFLLSSDSQWLSSLLLGKFIEYLQGHGLKCSTFDQGNAPDNDDWICCSVGDYFGEKGAGFNWGCGTIADLFIRNSKYPVAWKEFNSFVESKGGWLSSQLKKEVKMLWNASGDAAWPLYHARGLSAVGSDEDGLIWLYKDDDFRQDYIETGILG